MSLLANSVWSIALCSIHCYICITFPYQYREYMTMKKTILSILIISIMSFVSMMPPLFGWGKFVKGDNLCLVNARINLYYSIPAIS
ncbi:hypothetical protein MXB_1439, partial [Myxobolus squamalis]